METGFLFVKKKWEKNCRNDETKSENLVENRLEHPYGRKTPHWPSPTGATSEGQARHFAAEKQKKKEKAKRNDDNNNKKSRLTAAIYQRAGTDPLFSFSLILSFSLSLSVLISRHSFLAESHLVAQQPSDLFYFFVFFCCCCCCCWRWKFWLKAARRNKKKVSANRRPIAREVKAHF